MDPKIGLIVCGPESVYDFRIFLQSLDAWHPGAEIFVYTDTASIDGISKIKTGLKVNCIIALDEYTGQSRSEMESIGGKKYSTRWTDFMYEKANVIEYIFSKYPDGGVWFMDADIVHLAPLPIIPESSRVALSPHYIRDADCRLYGKYNGGYMWIKDKTLLNVWREAGHTSRFFEQAALEDVAAAAESDFYEFPIQVNFGWWRMFQSSLSPPEIRAKFSIYRPDKSFGIRFDGKPLQSIHTHMFDKSSSANGVFNEWLLLYIAPFANLHPPLRYLRRVLMS